MWRVLCDTGFRPSYQGTKASARLVAGLNGGGFIWHIKYPWWVTRVDCSCKTCIAYHISDCRKNLGCTSCNPPKPPTPPASKIPEIKPMVIPLHTLEALLSEQDVFHFIPNSKLPPHASAPAKKELNKSIKGNIVWLVDEYKTRKKIPPHVLMEQHQLDEFINGIFEVVQMYEGTYRLPGEPEPPEEEDDDFGIKI